MKNERGKFSSENHPRANFQFNDLSLFSEYTFKVDSYVPSINELRSLLSLSRSAFADLLRRE